MSSQRTVVGRDRMRLNNCRRSRMAAAMIEPVSTGGTAPNQKLDTRVLVTSKP